MNKFFTSLLVATAVGLSAVGTQAMPLRSNQAGQFDQFSRWWMWRRLSSRTVRRMPRQWLLRRSLLGHPGCSCARSGSGCSWRTMRRSRPASCVQRHGRLLDGLQLARDKLSKTSFSLQDPLAQERPPRGGLSYSRSPLLALSGHSNRAAQCLLSGVKQTPFREKRTSGNVR